MSNRKQDLTNYTDQGLSLVVFNDEGLYRMRRNTQFLEFLNDCFVFTEEQLEVLEQDLKDDLNEETENE